MGTQGRAASKTTRQGAAYEIGITSFYPLKSCDQRHSSEGRVLLACPECSVFGEVTVSTSEASPRGSRSEVASRGAREAMWPKAVIVFGITLTIAWTALLAFGVIKLIDLAM